MTRRVEYTFNGRGVTETGALVLDSRLVRCYEGNGTIAWTNSFKTRALAQSRFEGDLRAMGRNDCYVLQEVSV